MIITNARLIDGTGRVWDSATIQVEGERVASVTASGPDAPTEALDLAGKTVIPGLINAHTHLCLDGSANPMEAMARRSPTENVLVAQKHGEAALRAGITTVRDLGGLEGIDLGLKRAIDSGLVPGPRMLASGRVLCMTGGHGHFFGLEVDGADEARKGARQQLKLGADVIKVMATGGIMTPGVEPGSAQLTQEEMQAAIEEAHKAGRRTATHAQGTTGIKNALRAGIDSIEHGFYLDDEAIDLMLERGVFYVPTLAAPYHILEAGIESGIPAYAIEKTERVAEAHKFAFRRAHRAGVRIAAGNDGGTPFNRAENLVVELELMVQTGMTTAEALSCANAEAADLLGLSDQVGTVEPGKMADLVVLDSDPLVDISALRKVHMVIKGGRAV